MVKGIFDAIVSSGKPFDQIEIPLGLIIALDHAIFVGTMTNILFGVLSQATSDRSRIWAWADQLVFWLLNLVRSALGHGAQTLRHHVGGQDSTGVVTDAMASFISSAWRVALGTSWDIFWPAAVIAALVIAGQRVWRRDRQPQPTGGQPA